MPHRKLQILLLGFCSLLLGGISLSLIGFAKQPLECDRKTISMMMSPDTTWVALLEEETCSGSGPATTGITDVVQVFRLGVPPNGRNDVFAMAKHPLMRPALQWLDSSTIQVTVPNISLIGLRKRNYEGISVVIKFDPNEPDARASFLKSLGMPPD